MNRPGPSRVPPGQVPGGVVFRIYNRAGTMLVERALRLGEDVHAQAKWDSMKTLEALPASGKAEICLVCYDGDTGERWTEDDWMRLCEVMGRER